MISSRISKRLLTHARHFSARQHSLYAIARYMLSPVRLYVRPTVCLSVTRADD